MTQAVPSPGDGPSLAVPLGYARRIGFFGQLWNLRRCLIGGYRSDFYEKDIVAWRLFSRSYFMLNAPDAI